ncbi:MAG: hypothetical protein JXR16_10730 [Bermanella sp.]
MRITFYILITCLSFNLCANATNAVSDFSFEGRAFDLDTNGFLYKENHRVQLNERNQYTTSLVIYSDINNEVFAKKMLNFSANLMTPTVDFDDTRVGTTVDVIKADGRLNVRYKSASDEASAMIESVDMMVVDAGFDQMMIKYWDSLLKDKELEFEFLAPTRAQLISFNLKPISQNEEIIKLELSPSNFILGLLFDPIKLTYDKSTKRILIYEGLTNIEKFENGKGTGDYHAARIEYSY